MVQILPPKTSLGTQFGQAAGQGLAQGLEKGSNIGMQRGMLSNAFNNLKNLPQNASNLDITKSLLESTVGLPDQGKILQALTPYLVGGNRVQNLFGQQQQGQNANEPASGSQEGKGQQFGGFLPGRMTPEEKISFAKKYAEQHQDPGAFDQGLQIAKTIDATNQSSRNEFIDRAVQEIPQLAAHPERRAVFEQDMQEFSHLRDPNEIIKKASEKFSKTSNLLDSLERGYVPGAWKGLAKGAASLTGLAGGGLSSLFTKQHEARDKDIQKLQPTVKELINLGQEGYLRSYLPQAFGLSPTEVESLIHPLTPKQISSINSFPSASKVPQGAQDGRLAGLMKAEITPDTSLLDMRHRLWDQKGYDWEKVGPAIRDAEKKGLQLTPSQKAEMVTVENDPPIQSMSDIFRGWGRWIDYISGAK